MAIKFGVNLATPNPGGRDGSIATQKTNISSSLFHYVPRMARCAASQPLLLAGPLDAGPLRAPAIQSPLLHRWGRSNGNQIWGQSCHPKPSPPPPLSPPHSCCSRHIRCSVRQCRAVRVWLRSLNLRTYPVCILGQLFPQRILSRLCLLHHVGDFGRLENLIVSY